MCFPGALLAVQVAQTALSTAQASSQAKAEAKALRRAADRQRGEALARAESDRERAERLRASLRTGYARAGVVSEGSPAEALISLAADQEGEIQRQLVSGYADADELDTRAKLARGRGRASLLSAGLGVGETLADRHERKKWPFDK
jgi:hypothetical protein